MPPRQNLKLRGTKRLLGEWGAIMGELRRRGAIRSENSPAGDLAEALVAKHFEVELEPNSTPGYDLRLADKTRIQVKCRRRTIHSKPSHYGAMRSLDEDPFNDLVVVHFDEGFAVEACYRLPIDLVRELSRYSPHTNAWRLPILEGERAGTPGVERIVLGSSR